MLVRKTILCQRHRLRLRVIPELAEVIRHPRPTPRLRPLSAMSSRNHQSHPIHQYRQPRRTLRHPQQRVQLEPTNTPPSSPPSPINKLRRRLHPRLLPISNPIRLRLPRNSSTDVKANRRSDDSQNQQHEHRSAQHPPRLRSGTPRKKTTLLERHT